jgi:hypothetical protein
MRGQRSQSRCLRDSPRQSPLASASQSACPSRPQISITCNTSTISFGSRVRQTFLPPNELSVRRFLVWFCLTESGFAHLRPCPSIFEHKLTSTAALSYRDGHNHASREALPSRAVSLALCGSGGCCFFWIRPVRVCWPPERSLFEAL